MITQVAARHRAKVRRFGVATTLVVGVVLSIAAYAVASRTAMQRTIAQFNRLSVERAYRIESELRRDVEVLLAIRAFHAGSESVTPAELRAFVATATERYPAIRAVGWAPGPSYVVSQIATDTAAALTIGFDFSSRAHWQRARDAARDSGQLAIVEAPEFPGSDGDLIGIAAIYRNGVSHRTVVERRQALAGFVVCVMRSAVMLEALADTFWPTPLALDVRLYDHDADSKSRLLHTHLSRSRDAAEVEPRARPGAPRSFHYRRHFRFGDRSFAVVVTAAPEFLASHPIRAPASLLVGGFLATVVAAAYFGERRRRADAQRQQLEVAAALARVGRELIGVVETGAVLGRLGELTVHALDCDDSYTWLWDTRDDSYRAIAGYGLTGDAWAQFRDVRVPGSAWAPIVVALKTLGCWQITAAHADPLIATMIARFGGEAVLCVPLRRGTEIIGVQTAGYHTRRCVFTSAQEQIAVGVAQIASLALTNARMVEELADANRLKGEFVSTISHELRTPLNIMFGYMEFLRDAAFGFDERQKVLDRIEEQAKGLLGLIEHTLQIEKLEVGAEPLRIEEVSLPQLWESLAADSVAYPRQAAVALEWMPPPANVLVTDPQKVTTVLRNLVRNALKFTDEGSVRVEVSLVGDEVVFRVVDTGIGIPPDDQDAVFELFRQGDGSETRRYGGTGIGLYVVRKVVEQLRGRVEVHSNVGRGSVFTVTLPRTLEPSGLPRAA